MTIAYDGAKYKGWQKQKNIDSTIQGKLETVISKMTGEDVMVIGCGRTDQGVHAENYIANFQTTCPLGEDAMLNYLYEYLPEDILVKKLEEVPGRFHARHNLKSKTYVYKINNNKFRDVFNRKYAFHSNERFNLTDMRTASKVLIGTHDFQSFTNLKPNTKSTLKTINYININENSAMIEIEVNGNGFLLNMVRIIAATLMEVGIGKIKSIDIERILDAKKRWDGGPIAQAKGLFLREVQY